MRKSFAKMFAGPALFLGIAGALGAAVFTAPVVADDSDVIAVERQNVVPMSDMSSTIEVGGAVIGARASASSEEGVAAHLTVGFENTGDADTTVSGKLVLYSMLEMPGSRMGGRMEVMEEKKIEISLKAGELANIAFDFPGVSDPMTSCMVFFVPTENEDEQAQLIGFQPIALALDNQLREEADSTETEPEVQG